MEVHALLDIFRENRAQVKLGHDTFVSVLQQACTQLKILDPELGEQELIQLVAAELADLRQMVADAGQRPWDA